MAQERHHSLVVLSSCQAGAGGLRGGQPAGAVQLDTVQAAQRNGLLGLAELEVCASSLPATVASAGSDVAREPG
jgi:hypothetical protein